MKQNVLLKMQSSKFEIAFISRMHVHVYAFPVFYGSNYLSSLLLLLKRLVFLTVLVDNKLHSLLNR